MDDRMSALLPVSLASSQSARSRRRGLTSYTGKLPKDSLHAKPRRSSGTISYDPARVIGATLWDRLCPSALVCCVTSACCALNPFSSCMGLGGFQVVNEKEQVIVQSMGKLSAVLDEPGLWLVNPIGLRATRVSTAACSLELAKEKVIDVKGNPLLLSGIVVYRVRDVVKAALEVTDRTRYLRDQGCAVMKQIAALYPYESKEPTQPSLKTEATHIGREMIARLQLKVEPAGIEIIDFALTDLSYAQEIAGAMLVRQQAEALIDARAMIVQGAVDIAESAAKQLSKRGVEMTAHERARMVSNMMCIICGDANVQPTLNVAG